MFPLNSENRFPSKTGPRLDAFYTWLNGTLRSVSRKSTLAGAIRYALSRWPALTRYVDDGRIEIDNNAAERAQRVVALGSAALNGIEPMAYLRDVLSRIASEFSHFAQMPPAHPTPLDLAEVADAAVHLFASTPGSTVHLAHTPGLIVHADREHLLRTFNNLIKNALQAIPEEREGRVHVLLRREGNEAVAEVRDNGQGVPADTADQIFVPKFTTKSSGMGLGLPMVKRMVENAGGRVWFTTRPGEGSSFYLALPLWERA